MRRRIGRTQKIGFDVCERHSQVLDLQRISFATFLRKVKDKVEAFAFHIIASSTKKYGEKRVLTKQ